MAGHVDGTHGLGIVSSAVDVLWTIVVCGMRGVGVVCEMSICLARGSMGGEGGEWMRGLGLGFTNPERTGGVLDVCLCLGCGGVGGQWVGDLDKGLEGRCYICVSLDSLCRWQVQVSVYCAWRIPARIPARIPQIGMDFLFITFTIFLH